MTQTPTAAAEWRRHWPLPIAAGLGYATSVIHIYGIGPYVVPVSEAFGWSRTEVTFGLTIATLVQALGGVFIGLAVDRYGPRRFAIPGIIAIGAAFALMGTADGSLLNWYLLWCVIAMAALPVQASVWTSAVASRFHVSRGMAFAVTLCGASIAAAVFPLMATWAIGQWGWRSAFPFQAAIWVAISLPVILLFFRGARDGGRGQSDEDAAADKASIAAFTGAGLREGILTATYLRLWIASLLFTFTVIALVVHFVPIMTDRGAAPVLAAALASFVGWFSLGGRLGTGFLLDRFPASYVGALVFLLPVAACLLLLYGGTSSLALGLAAGLVGLTLGAEIDVVVYLVSRHFGLRNFGGLYGGLLAALSIGTALGPLAAARIFDVTGSYAQFLWLGMAMMAASSVAIATIPRRAPVWE